MTVLGVDIGGTKIATGLVNERAELSDFRVTPTRAAEGFEVSLAQVWLGIEAGLTPEVEAIGLCAPGPLNSQTGVVMNPPNLPWRDVPLLRLVRERFGLPAALEKDCNAAGLAEARYGAGRGHANVFYTAIGTGIGCGIILDGKIYRGGHGAAGEGGHVTIDYRSAMRCGCGTAGCIEALGSGRAFDGAEEEDFDELVVRLGAWMGGMMSLLDPGVVVIGGGVARLGERLFGRLRAVVPDWSVNPYAREIPIVPGKFAVEAGVIGAAAAITGDGL
jgi:glucokinase